MNYTPHFDRVVLSFYPIGLGNAQYHGLYKSSCCRVRFAGGEIVCGESVVDSAAIREVATRIRYSIRSIMSRSRIFVACIHVDAESVNKAR
jgi:hypothetical protein